MTIAQIAQVAHELNRAYCLALGDSSQPEWESAPEWQKSSAINGVQFHLDNPNATPENSHESWLAQKITEGWQYGPVKDAEAKTHPCIMPYDELPLNQRVKDYLFRQVIHSLKPYLEQEQPLTAPADTDPGTPQSTTLGSVTTEGMEVMDVTFNPSRIPAVNILKMGAAQLYDDITNYSAMTIGNIAERKDITSLHKTVLTERTRGLAELAKTHLEQACMLAVKAVTR